MPDKIKFGVFLPFYALKTEKSNLFNQLKEVVVECEHLGYHSVWLDDHLMLNKKPILECWSTLSALSTVTKKIRLGTMATCNSFRNPALLAKTAATIDIISNGRIELGIGAGIQKYEHNAYGFPFSSPKVRIERLSEAIEIIKKMWTEEKPKYKGKHYQIINPFCEPKPIQKPHPPITVCGGGEKLTLKVTAKHGDRYDWGYLPSLEDYKQKLKILENNCAKIGRHYDDIEKSCWSAGQLFMCSDNNDLEKRVAQFLPKDVRMKEFLKTNFAGTPEKYLQEIQQYLNLGVTNFMLFFGDLPNLRGLRIFAKELLNKKLN